MLPLVALLLLTVVQVGFLVRDQVLVVHATREAARAAAVDPSPGVPGQRAAAASGLAADRLEVTVRGRQGPGSQVTVTARYRSPTAVPVVGALLGDVGLGATVTMRVER